MRIKDIIQMGRNYLSAGLAFFIVVILIFCIGYFVVYKKVCKGTKKLDFKKVLWWTIFAFYLLVVISVTMLSRGDFWNSRVVSLFYSYKEAWVSASASAWRNIVLNILMFVPFGFWLPIGLKHFRVFWKTYLAGFAFTLVIETSQLALSHGIFEVADLLNNTVGAMIGFGCYEIVWQIILFIKKKKYQL